MALAPSPNLTAELLREYSQAALSNAEELLAEASLLLEHGHMARAYFLAVSCVEEVGKALHSFDAQQRNLADPAVCTRLRNSLENHSQKINYALSIWAMNDRDPRAAIEVAMDLIGHLRRGREPSMYTDLRSEPDGIQLPREVVRDKAAKDCIRLAEGCVANAKKHLSEKKPQEFTAAHDRLFVMKSRRFQEMLNTEDFWWFLVSRMEEGRHDFAETVLIYDREYVRADKEFRPKE